MISEIRTCSVISDTVDRLMTGWNLAVARQRGFTLIEPPASVLSYATPSRSATLSLGVHAGHCPNDLPAPVRMKGHNLRGVQQLAEASVLDIQYVLNALQLHHFRAIQFRLPRSRQSKRHPRCRRFIWAARVKEQVALHWQRSADRDPRPHRQMESRRSCCRGYRFPFPGLWEHRGPPR